MFKMNDQIKLRGQIPPPLSMFRVKYKRIFKHQSGKNIISQIIAWTQMLISSLFAWTQFS